MTRTIALLVIVLTLGCATPQRQNPNIPPSAGYTITRNLITWLGNFMRAIPYAYATSRGQRPPPQRYQHCTTRQLPGGSWETRCY